MPFNRPRQHRAHRSTPCHHPLPQCVPAPCASTVPRPPGHPQAVQNLALPSPGACRWSENVLFYFSRSGEQGYDPAKTSGLLTFESQRLCCQSRARSYQGSHGSGMAIMCQSHRHGHSSHQGLHPQGPRQPQGIGVRWCPWRSWRKGADSVTSAGWCQIRPM